MTPNKLELHKILLCITVVAFLTAQAQAKPAMLVDSYGVESFDDSMGDPLDPSILGESMNMPLPLWMINAAINAGIVKDSEALYAYDDGLGGYAGSSNKVSTYKDSGTAPKPTSSAMNQPAQSVQNVNVTGPWSLNLKGQTEGHLDLALVQNKEAVLGHGTLVGPNGTQRVAASGSLIDGRLELTAMLVDSLDLYKLNLSFDPNTAGTYTAYSVGGANWSGYVSGSAPLGISSPVPMDSETKTGTSKANELELTKPAQRSGVSSSTSIGMSSASSTNGEGSLSSTSESTLN